MCVRGMCHHGHASDFVVLWNQASLWPVAGRTLRTLLDTHTESVEVVTRCLACLRNLGGVEGNLVPLATAVPSVRAALLQHGDDEVRADLCPPIASPGWCMHMSVGVW